jgi:hypothetical protein
MVTTVVPIAAAAGDNLVFPNGTADDVWRRSSRDGLGLALGRWVLPRHGIEPQTLLETSDRFAGVLQGLEDHV